MDIKNIEKSIEITDSHILLREPIELIKYGKKVKIRPINWFYDWQKFSYSVGVFLHYYYIICENTKLPDSLNDLKEFKQNIRTTFSQKRAFKEVCKICKYSGFKLRWMKKHFNLDDWAEVFLTVFFCNLTLIGKGLKDALKAMGKKELI